MKLLQAFRRLFRSGKFCAACALSVLAVGHSQATDQTIYHDEILEYWKEHYERSIRWSFQHEILRALSEEEKRRLPPIILEFPVRDLAPFYSKSDERGTRIVLPIASLKFYDDLSVAFAWYSAKGYSLETIFGYLHQVARIEPSLDHRFAPLAALKIPADALDDPRVARLSKEVFQSTAAWIVSYHVGHAYYRHIFVPASPQINWANVAAADRFAFEIARRMRRVPYGAILYYQVAGVFGPRPSDLASPKEYEDWLREKSILPPATQRLRALSDALLRQARDFAVGEPDPANAEETVRGIARLIDHIAVLSEQPFLEAADSSSDYASTLSDPEDDTAKLKKRRALDKQRQRLDMIRQFLDAIQPRKLEAFNAHWSLNISMQPEDLLATESARLVLLVPKAMVYGEDHLVRLILGSFERVQAIEGSVSVEDIAYEDRVRIAPRMESRLITSDMDLAAVTPERQAVDSTRLTEWKWRVRPSKTGPQRLYLSIHEISSVEGSDLPRVIRSAETITTVHQAMTDRLLEFLSANWQWLWAAIVVPIVSVLWAMRRTLLR